MQGFEEALRLSIFIGEADRWQGHPLHEAIVLAAREAGLAGATVLRGALGYGHSSQLHSSKILRLSNDLPLLLVIIDRPEKIEGFLPRLVEMVQGGLIALEPLRARSFVKRES